MQLYTPTQHFVLLSTLKGPMYFPLHNKGYGRMSTLSEVAFGISIVARKVQQPIFIIGMLKLPKASIDAAVRPFEPLDTFHEQVVATTHKIPQAPPFVDALLVTLNDDYQLLYEYLKAENTSAVQVAQQMVQHYVGVRKVLHPETTCMFNLACQMQQNKAISMPDLQHISSRTNRALRMYLRRNYTYNTKARQPAKPFWHNKWQTSSVLRDYKRSQHE